MIQAEENRDMTANVVSIVRQGTDVRAVMPAIRTRETYSAALDRMAQLKAAARRTGSSLAELDILAQAVGEAPFRVVDGTIMAKGFTPRFAV